MVSLSGLWEDYSHPLGVWLPPVLSMVWSLAILSPPRSSSIFTPGSWGPALSLPPRLSLDWDLTSSAVESHSSSYGNPIILYCQLLTLPPCILHKTSLGRQVPSTEPRLRENQQSSPRSVLLVSHLHVLFLGALYCMTVKEKSSPTAPRFL